MNDEIYRPSAAINPERLDYLFSLAERMANSSMVPESLRMEGQANNKVALPKEQIIANVFAVCEQADRWNQSPFALLSSSAIVHGKLGFEGKVIAAVLEANFGIVLHHYFTGNPTGEDYRIYLCDRELPVDIINQLTPNIRVPGYNIMDGDVAMWKTAGNGSPWRPTTYGKMLVYRGTREWCRIYKPTAIMGILSDDELLEIDVDRRSRGARDITSSTANPLLESKPAMPMERFDPDTGEQIENSGAQADRTVKTTSARSSDDDSRASAAPARQAGRATDTRDSDRSPTNTASSTSSQGGGDGGGEEPRISSAVFKEYSQALLRFSSAENIEKGHNAFWDEKGGKPRNTADIELVKVILRLHKDRVQNGVAPDKLLKDANGAISQSFAI